MTRLRQTREGYVAALLELAAENPTLVVLDADVAKATKTCLFKEAFPERFFNCGAAEQNELSVAAGFALEGYLPFATTFAMFATARAADQFRNSIAYPRLNVKVAATHGGVTTGGDGASHQACEDIAYARALPHVTVLVPGDYEEARRATRAAAQCVGPVYLRLGRDNYPDVPEIHGEFHIGQAKCLRPGGDVTIATTGIMVHEGVLAVEELARRGVSARLLHLPTIKPLDEQALLAAARETRGIVTAEEHSILGGLGEAVASFLAEHYPISVRRVGVRDVFGQSGEAHDLLDHYGLRATNIVSEALHVLSRAEISP
jgi:transketolase